jgi:hypothetical protein
MITKGISLRDLAAFLSDHERRNGIEEELFFRFNCIIGEAAGPQNRVGRGSPGGNDGTE